ncbi:MFS transporter [Burkholderia gladioli]|uniref:MFS transporter n=1 Tax=Burkholderia gladioli TaxID=28095 RepID=A0AAP1UX87_BURGA|nr:MFS transporter [Burkholderia gladioli]AJW99236.1 sugar (and other) transporter family protein [Burkholderia gladioli]ASD78878.1 MFS transporter [Burkholderia gladioli pv. gladioli]AWY55874.1 MFS transporter [Burkholderia gladioli pv. gladioli]KGC10671.1 sugar (and other) transporter family protein [Burkholderia gladioli]MBJ9679598.1 MFS transporter [Burkholderia gladioli]
MDIGTPTSSATVIPVERASWSAVYALALGVFGLVTAEFLPASLLTPLAASLGITEGTAGQAVTVTAAVALVTSLLIAVLTRGIDRRRVLLAFSVLLVISNLLVASAGTFLAILLGRVLLGIALGGFWTMSAATAMRLVPAAMVPRALSIIFSGVAVATIAAAPLGSYFGHLIGWRNVFYAAAAIGALALAAQFATLPSMAPSGTTRLRTLLDVLRRPTVGIGMFAVTLVFTGHFAFFTYLRPFLEDVAGVGVNALSAILLGYGVANFLFTPVAGRALERGLRPMMIAMPALMVVLGAALALFGKLTALDAVLVALWGAAFGGVPVAWSTWVTRVVPDEAESAGGLIVAAIQLAISLGAAAGGVVFDTNGATGVFVAAAVVLVVGVTTIVAGVPVRGES